MNPCNVFHIYFAIFTSQFKHAPKNFLHFSAVFSLFGATWRYIHIGGYANKEVNMAKARNKEEMKRKVRRKRKGEKRKEKKERRGKEERRGRKERKKEEEERRGKRR